jgi:predicted small lipoprotein YifL
MRTIASAPRARTAALTAAVAAALALLGCAESGPLTAPPQAKSASQATITLRGPRYSGYALASGRVADSLQVPQGK